jgi:Family of unknown function (DUF5906)
VAHSTNGGKPITHQTDLAKLPRCLEPLVVRPQWAVWRWVPKADGGWTKPPFMAVRPDRHVSTTDPGTWSDYATALAAVQAGQADGISYVLTEDDPYAAIDMDHCRHVDTHSIDVWAQNFLEQGRDTYTEVTPSGTGCRIWGLARGDRLHRKFTVDIGGKEVALELFRHTHKALTITGLKLNTCRELTNIDRVLDRGAIWGERRKAAAAAAAINGNGFSGNGSGSGYSVDQIELIVRTGAPEGANRSDLFHTIVGHYVGCGWSAEQILAHLQQFPTGIGGRYLHEERLAGEIARSANKFAAARLPLFDTGGWTSEWRAKAAQWEQESPEQDPERQLEQDLELQEAQDPELREEQNPELEGEGPPQKPEKEPDQEEPHHEELDDEEPELEDEGLNLDDEDQGLDDEELEPDDEDLESDGSGTTKQPSLPYGVRLDDFYAYMPMHNYLFAPSRELWPASSVNARIPPVPIFDVKGPVLDERGKQKKLKASTWLDQNKAVEQMTWAPGLPMLIRDRLISEGGWIDRKGVACFNLYRPPTIQPGSATKAGLWLEHAHKVFGDNAKHIVGWLAHRVQRPQEKINHALVFGGQQGIGKDSLLEPVKRAIGPWNFQEVSPQNMLGRFNGYLKSVILRLSEARDLGDINRYQFYDHMKAYTAAPPDVLRVDEKNLREYGVFNCCGVILTTNHKTDGIYLPADDRRHFVAWSDLTKEDFVPSYWNTLWGWYARGGDRHVTAYLRELDITSFDPKAPPPKTLAFWDIVDANRAPEDAELADVFDKMGNPDATTLSKISIAATGDFKTWITDRRNRRVIPYRLEQCGYVPVRNDARGTGLWVVDKIRQAIYAKATLSVRDRLKAARSLIDRPEPEEAPQEPPQEPEDEPD